MPRRSNENATVYEDDEPSISPRFLDERMQRLFRRMQKDFYPSDLRDYLACPFWRLQQDKYEQVRQSTCLGWGFKDIGQLNEHIKKSHCRSTASKSGGRREDVPLMSEARERSWREKKSRRAGSRREKWWWIAEGCFESLAVRIPEADRPKNYHLHFPGPDFFTVSKFMEYFDIEVPDASAYPTSAGGYADPQDAYDMDQLDSPRRYGNYAQDMDDSPDWDYMAQTGHRQAPSYGGVKHEQHLNLNGMMERLNYTIPKPHDPRWDSAGDGPESGYHSYDADDAFDAMCYRTSQMDPMGGYARDNSLFNGAGGVAGDGEAMYYPTEVDEDEVF